MKRFLKYLQYFNPLLSFYLYISHKIKFIKEVPFFLNGHKLWLRPGKSEFLILNQIFVDDQYASDLMEGNQLVIIDGGANVGLSSVYFNMKYPNSKIYCFEPDEDNFKMLVKNTKEYPNTVSYNNGIWYQTTDLFLNRKSSTCDFYLTEIATENTTETINCIGINDFVVRNEIESIDILKLDIEGSELYLFQNEPEKWLPKVKCLMIETHDRFVPNTAKTLFKVLENYNYTFEVSGETLKFFNLNKIR